MKRAPNPEHSGAGSSAPAAQRPRIDPAPSTRKAAPPANSTNIPKALEAVTSFTRHLEAVTSFTRGALLYQASNIAEGAKQSAPFDPDALAGFLDARRTARRGCQTLARELQALDQNLEAEVTVLNINAAALLERKRFSLQEGIVAPPTVGSVLKAIWARVSQLVQQCGYEERAAANTIGKERPVQDADTIRKEDSFQQVWWGFLLGVEKFSEPTKNRDDRRDLPPYLVVPAQHRFRSSRRRELPVWIAREWTGAAGVDGNQSSISLELLPATKEVYCLAECDVIGGGQMLAILVSEPSSLPEFLAPQNRGTTKKEAAAAWEARNSGAGLLLPVSSFLSRAALNVVVFAVQMKMYGEWYKVYAGDLVCEDSVKNSNPAPGDLRTFRWQSTVPGQEQYDSQRKKDVAATHGRFPGLELSEVREKILAKRDLHRLGRSSSGSERENNNKPIAHRLSLTGPGASRVDELLRLVQMVEKATRPDPSGSVGASGAAGGGEWFQATSEGARTAGGTLAEFRDRREQALDRAYAAFRKREAKAQEGARAAFLERLGKNTNPEAGLAPLVKSYLNLSKEARMVVPDGPQKIMLVPDGGDPASAEPCRPEDRLLGLLTSKNADGSARGGWKWLGPGRVEMQFYAMIQ